MPSGVGPVGYESTMCAADLGGWPFRGRADELRRLRRAVADRGALVVGGAGVGKSALVASAALRPAGRFLATAPAADRELWAVQALAGGARPGDDPVADLVAALRPAHRGAGAPLLVIDDVDLLDTPSAAVVVRAVEVGAVRLVATRRAPAPPGRPATIRWDDLGLEVIEVGPLDEDEVAEVLRAALGGPLDGRAVAELSAVAAGIPFLLREVVTGSLASGSLVLRGGLWRLVGPIGITSQLAELAVGEVEGLSASQHDALELLAVAGPVPGSLADRLLAAADAEPLERAGLLRGEGTEEIVALASPVLAEALRRDVGRTARRRHSRVLADAAEALAGPGSALELPWVTWQLASGRPVPPDRALAAARLAVDAGDTRRAEDLAARAGAAAPSTEAVLLESWCAEERGDLVRAEAVLADHRPDGDEASVAVAIRQAEQRFWGHRDPEGARARLEAAARSAHEPWPGAVRAQQAVFDVLDGNPQRALDVAAGLVGHPERLVGSTAALAVTLALTAGDRAPEAELVAESALAGLAGPSPALFIDPGVHVIGLVFALHGAGELDAADALAAEVYRHTLGRVGRQAQGWAALVRAQVLASRGRPAAAAEAALEAEFVWANANLQGPARWSATVAALAHADAGEVDELRACVARADGYDAVPFRLFEPEVLRSRGWLAHHEGRPAAPVFADAAELAASTGRLALAAGAAHDLVRIGEAAAAVEVLESIVDPGPVTVVRLALARAGAAGDGLAMLAAADAFSDLGASGWATEARALAAHVLPARAAVLHAEVAAAARDLGLATPPVRSLVDQPSAHGLTAREAEVVRLAAGGLANRAIAEELVVSLRTVENHLHRAFAKLGVRSRSELSGAGRAE
jgi:DNA-binding CsgD family transcriptional regulator